MQLFFENLILKKKISHKNLGNRGHEGRSGFVSERTGILRKMGYALLSYSLRNFILAHHFDK